MVSVDIIEVQRKDRLLPGGVFKDALDGMAVGRKVSTGWEHSERR